jgi:hypothetical protein
MKARISILARLAEGGAYETIGVLVLGRDLVFVATDPRWWEAYGRQIEAAASRHEDNGVTLEEIFEYYAGRDLGPVESWSKPQDREGKSERDVGEHVLSTSEFVARPE